MKNKDRIEVLEAQIRSLQAQVDKLEAAQPVYPSPLPQGELTGPLYPYPWHGIIPPVHYQYPLDSKTTITVTGTVK